jgi:hypothetical protein
MHVTGEAVRLARLGNNGTFEMTPVFPARAAVAATDRDGGGGGDDSMRYVVTTDAAGRLLTLQQQQQSDRLERTLELQVPAYNLTAAITFTNVVFSQRRQLFGIGGGAADGVDPLTMRRPWIEFLSLPLNEENPHTNNASNVVFGGVMETSGLLGGLRQLSCSSPPCWNMFCLTLNVCGPMVAYCCPHLLGRIAALAGGSGNTEYPTEYTSNFVAFSRQFICPAATPMFSGGCRPGWQRHNYRCYRLFVSGARPVAYRQAVSACRGHDAAKLVIFAPSHVTSSLLGDQKKYLEEELGFVTGLLRDMANRTRRRQIKNTLADFLPDNTSSPYSRPLLPEFTAWVGGRNGFPEPCLRLDSSGQFVAAAASGDGGGGADCTAAAAESYVCVTNGCESSERHCCRLTREEHLRWERRVLGKSFILRPAPVWGDGAAAATSLLPAEHALTLNLAYGAIGGTVAFVVVYRIVTRELEQRRYTARSLTKY